eukprot:CAMPEP_0113607306 /NCGR_PEP_ID=MMETSP0017_2-20120614/3315_1 /TAXON_ID=2856 /ORGANISM="Cylindrotheca closterium" /LENGTH=466 /DNA_ID=CAMNT_0000515903 /DNA_START=29 /DNA_END=1426 /DNA_ORIENTATION=+ /assembly_acc=CAM_ASM_000147
MKLCSGQCGVTVVGMMTTLLLLLSAGYVHSQEPRSLRTSHKTHICDKDFQPTASLAENNKDASSADLQTSSKQWKLEYHLNLQESGTYPERDASSEFEYLVALHFNSFELDPRCTLEIWDKHNELVTSLAGIGPFWSEQIKGLSARLVLNCSNHDNGTADDDEEPPQFKSSIMIDEYVVIDRNVAEDGEVMRRKLTEANEQRNLDICRNDDLKNAQCYEATHPEAFQVANSVVRMKYGNDFCTGWMISPGLLMTAGHCVITEEEVVNTEYQFSYASTLCDADSLSVLTEIIKPVELVKIDKISDYAIIRMTGNPGFKYGYLSLENSLPALNDAIYIPQHPSGRDVELAIVETSPFAAGGLCSVRSTGQGASDLSCEKYGASFKDFTYYCDTEGGSSGAPVLSATTNKVIGLHHCGGTCENFAIPIPYIYNAVNSYVISDIATAVRPPAPTMPPTAATGGTAAPGVV